MSKSKKLLILVGLAAIVGYIVYSTLELRGIKCEVCMEFRERTACRTAWGTTREEAAQSATNNACALIASGREDSIRCNQMTPPQSVSCTEP
jgi:hypothetical protein